MLNQSLLLFDTVQTLNDNQWTRPALASCYTLKWIGGYLCLVFIFGIFLNGIILYTLLKKSHSQTPVDIFMIVLSSADLSHALFGIPLSMTSNLACRWLYGKYPCYFEGFMAYFVGMIGLYILTALSLNRYWMIVTSAKFKYINSQTAHISIVIAILGSFFWAIAPVFGWNDYTLEVTFVVAWTPYAVVVFISSFLSPTLISPLGATLPGTLIFSCYDPFYRLLK
ncbi:hypothetical protein I4U23_000719 [Adineta vaga]|nr:hypothetical protein I4U23_000719 [Adineta vaga]